MAKKKKRGKAMTVTRYINGKPVSREELSSYVLNTPQYLSAVTGIRSRDGREEQPSPEKKADRHEG